ncbi:hypothetical protein PW5551_05175 [Petrotoga sp. 9PW.55.5.1]|uniref:hypothetical protein n=1 Tax=Petrotoga sp. 9PW.55.5.1 TaxID=1308979 RepID=UPI000DC481F4|nr:hypothetical protein [Petrotoga sp. 9PW.55.5.1]RAO99191.1 hypothetical protein PW5551_05175 [Petrotoga sp. 9PW.55.5.1]
MFDTLEKIAKRDRKEAMREGIEKGKLEGKREGKLEGEKEFAIKILSCRFGNELTEGLKEILK